MSSPRCEPIVEDSEIVISPDIDRRRAIHAGAVYQALLAAGHDVSAIQLREVDVLLARARGASGVLRVPLGDAFAETPPARPAGPPVPDGMNERKNQVNLMRRSCMVEWLTMKVGAALPLALLLAACGNTDEARGGAAQEAPQTVAAQKAAPQNVWSADFQSVSGSGGAADGA